MPLDSRGDLPKPASHCARVERFAEAVERTLSQRHHRIQHACRALFDLRDIGIEYGANVVEWLAVTREAAREALTPQAFERWKNDGRLWNRRLPFIAEPGGADCTAGVGVISGSSSIARKQPAFAAVL